MIDSFLFEANRKVTSLQMHFFNQYKDLFGVPAGLGVPMARLRLDNQLFIEKTYIPTKTQQYSLNGKIRELKKDYEEFQHRMEELTKFRETPKRSFSRKGKESDQKSPILAKKYNENRQVLVSQDTKVQRPSSNTLKPQNNKLQKQNLMKDMLKRESWFKDQQNNILKHSQLDFIFQNKLNKVYDLDQIKANSLPRPTIQLQNSYDQRSQKQNVHFSIKQRSKPSLDVKKIEKSVSVSNIENARLRRQKAKNNLEFRRKKLESLLKTLW